VSLCVLGSIFFRKVALVMVVLRQKLHVTSVSLLLVTGTAVSAVTRLWAGRLEFDFQWGLICSPSHSNWLWGPPSLPSVQYGGSFVGNKVSVM
jgi:hypothetical protein